MGHKLASFFSLGRAVVLYTGELVFSMVFSASSEPPVYFSEPGQGLVEHMYQTSFPHIPHFSLLHSL